MFKKIFQTIVTKFLAAIFGFLVVVVTSKFLGAEGKGMTSLIITTVAIIMLVSDVIGGTVLVYLVPRTDLIKLLIPAYAWGLISCIGLSFLFHTLALIPNEYSQDLFFLS